VEDAKLIRNSFQRNVEKLEQVTQALLKSMPCMIREGLPRSVPKAGIYLFSDGTKPLYVGRSNNIRRRMGLHTRPSAAHNQATFAFRLTKEQLGIGKPSYQTKGSRPDLAASPRFAHAFRKSKDTIRSLNVRFIEENDPVMQALLEIYIAVTLGTPYNEFKTT
jgi:hypothetical protein